MQEEHFAGDTGVCASGKLDLHSAVGDPKLGFKRARKRLDSGTAGANQGAVNVE
jgi:hypothetical protein